MLKKVGITPQAHVSRCLSSGCRVLSLLHQELREQKLHEASRVCDADRRHDEAGMKGGVIIGSEGNIGPQADKMLV